VILSVTLCPPVPHLRWLEMGGLNVNQARGNSDPLIKTLGIGSEILGQPNSLEWRSVMANAKNQ
jgi:hypothetical protein